MTNRRIAAAGALAFVTMFGLFALAYVAGVRWNVTPSVPTGLYLHTSAEIAAGQLVTACLDPSNPAVAVAIERRYLPPGHCPGGTAPVLKPVVAMAGDHIHAGIDGLAVNGHVLPNTRPLATDPRGRELPRSARDYTVPAGMVVLIVSNPTSFDSRYFGAVPISRIESAAKPLLLF